jgi:hypothetical protein
MNVFVLGNAVLIARAPSSAWKCQVGTVVACQIALSQNRASASMPHGKGYPLGTLRRRHMAAMKRVAYAGTIRQQRYEQNRPDWHTPWSEIEWEKCQFATPCRVTVISLCTMALKGTIPTKLWEMNNQGYAQNWNSQRYKLARQYLAEMGFWPDQEFAHNLDCEYLGNFCHWDTRGPFYFYRPSACVKFPLKKAASVYNNPNYRTSYHGTASAKIKSILTYGLLPPGQWAGSTCIQQQNGEKLGIGVYTSPSPLYAQLYAPLEMWRGHYVQTVLMVRQPARDIVWYQDEGCASASLIGRNDIWRLYGGTLHERELQMKTESWRDMVIQALIVKIHDQNPTSAGGEYHRIRELLGQI